MIETKYDVINSFTEYKNALESSEENMFRELGHCDGFKAKCDQYGDKNCVSTCQVVYKYLSLLKDHPKSTYMDKGCKYLYYWLNNISKNNSHSALSYYKALLQGYEDVLGDDEFNDYINHDNKEIFDKLIDLFELYDKLNNLKDEKLPPKDKDCIYIMDFVTSYEKNLEVCLNGNDIDFCNQLEKFKQDYEKKLTQLTCPDNVPKFLQSTKAFSPVFIFTIIFVILLVKAFILFIIYKFTPLGTRLLGRIGMQKKVWDNLDQETHQYTHMSEQFNKNSENRNYHIAYNYAEGS